MNKIVIVKGPPVIFFFLRLYAREDIDFVYDTKPNQTKPAPFPSNNLQGQDFYST